MLTPDMKLVMIRNQMGPLRSPAKSIGIAINPSNMRNAINKILQGVCFVSLSFSTWFSVARRVYKRFFKKYVMVTHTKVVRK